ncbi:MAG: M10 family metallopeptidase C-terminal domain-containing protein [Planctomycetaceae bacterium]|nr:M10 family metallopeptidase C-terminal domain-containing protein [Planctomycetaceae bacterium]
MNNFYKPRVNVRNFSLMFGEAVMLRDFVSFSDQDHDGQFYHVRIRDNSNGGTGFRLGNAVTNLATNVWHSVTFNQFINELRMVGGAGAATDNFQIQVFDGVRWSDISAFAVQTIGSNANQPNIVGTTPINRPIYEHVMVWDHFQVQDADNSTARRYRFRDSSVGGGYLVLNGVKQAENVEFEITAGQLGQLEYYTGTQASNEQIMVSAYDGRFWGNWGQIAVTNLANNAPPVLTFANPLVRLESRVELSRFFGYTDADGNTLKKVRILDWSSADPSGYWMMDDTRLASGVWHEIDAKDMFRVTFVGAKQSWFDTLRFQAYDGSLWSSQLIANQLTVNNRFAPTLRAISHSTNERAFRALTALFDFSDQDGDLLQFLRVRSYGTEAWHGRFFRAGVEMANNVWHTISRTELGMWEYQAGAVKVNTQVGLMASDGFSFTSNQVLDFRAVSSTPVVTGIDRTILPETTIAVSSLFSYTDKENQPMLSVRIKDTNTFVGSGSLYLNGVKQDAGVWYEFAGNSINNWTFRSNEHNRRDRIQIEAWDGYAWSNVGESWVTGFSNKPVVTTDGTITVKPGTVFQLANLFTYSDVDGHSMKMVRVTEGNADAPSGFFSKNGVQQNSIVWHDILAGDLASWTFTAHSLIGSDQLRFSAYDGYVWSDIKNLDVTTTTTAPTITPINRTVLPVTALNLSNLFSYFDADGDPMHSLRVRDENSAGNSGYFTRDGVAQAAGVQYTILASEVSRWQFVSGDFLGFDEISFWGNDSFVWGNLATGRVTSDTRTPSATPFNYTLLPGASVNLVDLFSYSDPDNLPIRWVRIRDTNVNLNSGNFMNAGAPQSPNTWLQVSAAEFANWSFMAGAHSFQDSLQIEVSNGYKWSSTVTAVVNSFSSTPTVSVWDRAVNHNDQIRLSYLFNYDDVDGDPLARIRIIDRNDDINTGSLMRNGIAMQPKVWHEIAAADLDNWTFSGGVYLTQDSYSIQVSDGHTWSDIADATIFWRNLYDPKLSKGSRPAAMEPAFSTDLAINHLFDFNQGDNFQVMGEYLFYDGNSLDPNKVYTFTRAQFSQVRVAGRNSDNGSPLLNIADVRVRVQINNVWSQWSSVNVLDAPRIYDALDTETGLDEFWVDQDGFLMNRLEYAFVSDLPFYYAGDSVERVHGHGFMSPNAKTRAAIRQIMNVYESMINMVFVEVPEFLDFDLGIGWMDMTDYPTSQYAYTVLNAGVVHDPDVDFDHTIHGDMWFNTAFGSGAGTLSLTDPDQGEYGYTTYIREIGRALGLAYTNAGSVVLHETPYLSPDWLGISHTYNSVLSREADYNPNPITPMLYDVLELQSRYGANVFHATGDNLYVFDDTQPRVRLIWDAGGNDTISFETANLVSGDGFKAVIDLREGGSSFILDPSIPSNNRDYYRFGRLTVAINARIERALGSNGDDVLLGNNYNNVLFGGLGNDVLIGGGGDDELDGGLGNDRYIVGFGHQGVVAFGHRAATLFENAGGGHDRLEVYDTDPFFEIMKRPVIFQRDFAFHRDDQNLSIELTLDNNAAESTIRLRRMDLAASQIETLAFGATNVDLVHIFNSLAADGKWTRFQLSDSSSANGLLVAPL